MGNGDSKWTIPKNIVKLAIHNDASSKSPTSGKLVASANIANPAVPKP